MKIEKKTSTLGAIAALGLCTSMSAAEIISFEVSGTVASAINFDAASGIWAPVSEGQSWSLSFEINTDTMTSSGFPDIEMNYQFSEASYDFRIGDVSISESGNVISASSRTGNKFFDNRFGIGLSSETHLGLSLGWFGDDAILPGNAMPTADELNSIADLLHNPFAFTTNGFVTPDGPEGDLAFLQVDSINISVVPTPMSAAPFAVMGFIATRRRRSSGVS